MNRHAITITAAPLLLALTSPARADVTLNVFGDVDYAVIHQAASPTAAWFHAPTGLSGGTTNAFSAPMVDLFATDTVGKVAFLTELVAEVNPATNEFAFDIERVEVNYRVRPWLRLHGGRFHTAFGYYNDAFHHGKYFMLAVDRPGMVEFEDGGGLLPAHGAGVHADGDVPLGEDDAGKLHYDLEVTNGRGKRIDEITSFTDHDQGKAVNVRLRYVGAGALDGLTVGGNAYVDHIPADEANGSPAQREVILGGHLVYIEDKITLISELAHFRHREDVSAALHTTTGLFVEGGYALGAGDLTPFVRYEQTSYGDARDPYFAAEQLYGSYKQVSLGAKYNLSENLCLKAQAIATSYDILGHRYAAVGQAAFAF
jgi:hypothetical protein